MGLIYRGHFAAVAVTAVQDLFEITAPSDAAVIIHSISITQDTDAGDSEAEMLRIEIGRSTDAGAGSGGTTITARPAETGFPASGSVVHANNTTQTTVITVEEAEAFNVQAGYFHKPVPEERYVVSPADVFVVSLDKAPADTMNMSGTIVFEEIGG